MPVSSFRACASAEVATSACSNGGFEFALSISLGPLTFSSFCTMEEEPLRAAFAELAFTVDFRFFVDSLCDLSELLDEELLRVTRAFLRPAEGPDLAALALPFVVDSRVRVEVNFDVPRGDPVLPDVLLLEDRSPGCFFPEYFDSIADFLDVIVNLSRTFGTALFDVLLSAMLLAGADRRVLLLLLLLFDALLDLMLFDSLVSDLFLLASFDRTDNSLDALVILRGRFGGSASKVFLALAVLVDFTDLLTFPCFLESVSFDLFSFDGLDDRFDDLPIFECVVFGGFFCALGVAAVLLDLRSDSAFALLELVFRLFCTDVGLAEELSSTCRLRGLVGFFCPVALDKLPPFEIFFRPFGIA